MAINATSQWRIRAGGNNINGGGYDPGISGAGTDYTDQDSPQLSLSDFATSGAGSTTLTSATGGFTSAMIGNCVRIASGTNFQTGYYFITAYTDTNTVTVDRTPTSGGAGSSGVGRIGGAFANIIAVSNSAVGVSTPLAAGHTVYIRGSGGENPGSADYTHTTFYQFPLGNTTNGRVRFVGYNGRPRIDVSGMLFYLATNLFFENLHFKATSNSFAGSGIINEASVYNCWFDQAGFDIVGAVVLHCEDSYFFNSGSATAGGYAAISMGVSFNGSVSRNFINGWKGRGISFGAKMGLIAANVVSNCKNDAMYTSGISNEWTVNIFNNTCYNNTGNGLRLDSSSDSINVTIANNLFESNSSYGINFTAGTQAANDRRMRQFCRQNFFYNNASGPRNGISAGAFDVMLTSSAFTNAAGGDFSLNSNAGGGALVRAGSTYAFKGSAGTSYLDGGAIQAQATGGGYRQVNIRGGADQ